MSEKEQNSTNNCIRNVDFTCRTVREIIISYRGEDIKAPEAVPFLGDEDTCRTAIFIPS